MLAPHARKSGLVTPSTFHNAFDRGRVRAGFKPSFTGRKGGELPRLLADVKKRKAKLAEWPPNGLRHSAISYRLATTRNISKVALEAGNSPAVIRQHYLEFVKPSAAVAYFSLTPSEPETSLPCRRRQPR